MARCPDGEFFGYRGHGHLADAGTDEDQRAIKPIRQMK